MEGKDKLLALKLDNLWKHGGRKKTLISIPIVYKARKIHMRKNLVHAKNEHMYANVKKGTMSQPHFEASVRMRLTLPKVGTWSPPRLPKFQSSIARVKTPCLEMFFIPLERS